MEGKLAGNRSPFYSSQDTETHSAPIRYSPPSASAAGGEREGGARGTKRVRKSKHAAARLSMCSLSMFFFFF
jgi:hypothetical protein